MRTRFALFHGPGEITIEEKDLPPIGPDQVLLKVELCGICGTDFLISSGTQPVKTPYHNLGHEYSARVEDTGAGIDWLTPGDRVVVNPNIWCGRCEACREGLIHLCTRKAEMWSKSNGGFADYSVVSAVLVHKIPDCLPAERAIFAEPLSCCLHAVARANVRPGARVAVLGGGTMGQLMLLVLMHGGNNCIVLSEPVASKREIAIMNGADRAMDPLTTNLIDELQDQMDLVVDCTGRPEAIAEALEIARFRGTVIALSLYGKGRTVPLEPDKISRKELTIVGAIFAPFSLPAAIRMVARDGFWVERLLGRRCELRDLPKVMRDPDSLQAIKIAVKP